MDPITLASIGIPALFNLGRSLFGASQLNQKRPTAPTYEIPSAVNNYLRQRQIAAGQEMPGYGLIEEKIGSQVAGSIGDVSRAATSSSAALGEFNDINQSAIDAIKDIGIRASEYRAGQQDKSIEAQKMLADYQEKAWEYNKNIPYQRAMNEYFANKQAGSANLWGGLEGIGSSIIGGMSNTEQSKNMQALIDAIKGI